MTTRRINLKVKQIKHIDSKSENVDKNYYQSKLENDDKGIQIILTEEIEPDYIVGEEITVDISNTQTKLGE